MWTIHMLFFVPNPYMSIISHIYYHHSAHPSPSTAYISIAPLSEPWKETCSFAELTKCGRQTKCSHCLGAWAATAECRHMWRHCFSKRQLGPGWLQRLSHLLSEENSEFFSWHFFSTHKLSNSGPTSTRGSWSQIDSWSQKAECFCQDQTEWNPGSGSILS